MRWNKERYARQRADIAAAKYAAPDPEYTITKAAIFSMFKWNWKHLKQATENCGFPAPKRFAHDRIRWHPQQINDWLRARDGDTNVGSWKQ